MHIFVAGPGQDCRTFDPALLDLERAGYTAETGLSIIEWGDPACQDDWIYLTLETLKACEGVALLDGWRCSPGAMFEVGFAAGAGLPCMPLKWWLSRAQA